MENHTMRIQTVIFFVLSILFLFQGRSFSQPTDSPPQGPPPAPVYVSAVVEKTIRKPVSLAAVTFPAIKSVVSTEVAGIVETIVAQEGEYVRKGEVLAEIKSEKTSLSLQELKNDRTKALVNARLSEKDLQRTEDLYKKGILSDEDLDRAETRRDSDLAVLRSLESRIDMVEYDLTASKITAPFNGYVTEHHAEIGQWADEGGRILSFVNIDTVEVWAGLPEAYLGQVVEGSEVEIIITSLGLEVFRGEIAAVVPDADPKAVSFPMKIVLPNPEHRIKSSVSAVVKIRVGEKEKIMCVPKDAVVRGPAGTVVFVVRDDAAHPVPVKSIGWYGNDTHIEGSVSVGENVVVRGNERLVPMQKVRIVETMK